MKDIEFVIHEIAVGGGILAISPMPGRTRHYYADWLTLVAWKPALVITLTEQAELDRKGAGTLGSDLRNADIDWLHLPVPDYSVPQGINWPAVAQRIHRNLIGGGRVLVHCFGGCGRSGMLVLRVMIAAGETPNAALQRLRRTRSCAVETDQQMTWALQG